jgi:hypothetical protein
MEALYCTFYQSAPPWRLYTALYVSWPLCGGFILHFLLLSPFVEVSYLLVGPWRPPTSLSICRPLRGGLALRFHQSASVEALYCSVAVRRDDETICQRETLFTHHFGAHFAKVTMASPVDHRLS